LEHASLKDDFTIRSQYQHRLWLFWADVRLVVVKMGVIGVFKVIRLMGEIKCPGFLKVHT